MNEYVAIRAAFVHSRKDAELLFKGRPLARLIRCCFAQIAFVDDEIVRHTLHIPAGLMFAGL